MRNRCQVYFVGSALVLLNLYFGIMALEAIKCPHCNEVESVIRHGTTEKGTQRYRCYSCKKSFLQNYSYRAHLPEVKAQISQMAMNGNGVRDTARVLKVCQNTVISHLKKSNDVVYVNPAYAFEPSLHLILKADEMWSFVEKKRFHSGFGGLKTVIMDEFCFYFWTPNQCHLSPNKENAYQCWHFGRVLDYRPMDRISGLSERSRTHGRQSSTSKHLTLRTRIKRLTRKTICCSKSEIIHKTIIGLFIK